MIETITTSAYFERSRATMSGAFQPLNGITAVVGGNGTGKTFRTIEAIRWLLYGKAALRGAATDYKQAEASGTFVIRDARYHITRGKKESIKDDAGTTLAVGAEKVTERVIELIGYGLDVFDICNAATQGDVQTLGKLRPAERKALIDKVLRLTDVEAVEKACRDEAKSLRLHAEALSHAARAPGAAPVAPRNYQNSVQLRRILSEERSIVRTNRALRDQIRHVIAPCPPTAAKPDSQALALLQHHENNRLQSLGMRAELERIVRASTERPTEEQIAAAVARYEWTQLEASRGPRPTMTVRQVLDERETWERISALRQIEDMETTCPKCAHTFRTRQRMPDEPSRSLQALQQEQNALTAWATPLPPEPTAAHGSYPEHVANVHRQANRAAVALAAEKELEDKSPQLLQMQRLVADWDAYLRAVDAYEDQVEVNQALTDQLAPNEMSIQQLDELSDRLAVCERYEEDCARHNAETDAFSKAMADIAEKSRMAEEFKKGSEGLADARAMVKAMLAPRISRIASSLISDMTMGKLTEVVMDDDMDITVNGQRIETLSGAGKTVANLALRVAMGQALVARAFPVFLADEIDGDLDAERREATLMALASLKKHLKQIILVTHRSVDIADHVYHTENPQ